jgi:hypothetical protein
MNDKDNQQSVAVTVQKSNEKVQNEVFLFRKKLNKCKFLVHMVELLLKREKRNNELTNEFFVSI